MKSMDRAHVTPDQIRRFRERQLSGPARLGLSEHLQVCPTCRSSVFRGAPSSDFDLAALLADEDRHLSYDELAAVVDRTLSAEEVAPLEDHLAACGECSTEMRQLLELRKEIDASSSEPAPFRPMVKTTPIHTNWPGWLALAASVMLVVGITVARRWTATPITEMASQEPAAAKASSDAASRTDQIRDGGRVVALESGRVAGLDGLEESHRATVERALLSRRVEVPEEVGELAGKPGVLLGSTPPATGPAVLAPVGVVVWSLQPRFRWRGSSGATYLVSVFDDKFSKVTGSGALTAETWQPPTPLPAGRTYSWQLTVRQNGTERTVPTPPAPEARFRTLDPKAAGEVARAQAALSDSPLVLAIIYADFGLLDDAEEKFEAARQENPDSEIVTELAMSLQRLRTGFSAAR